MDTFHRDSQKRMPSGGYPVFITTNTQGQAQYFSEDILCDLFVYEMQYACRLKKFEILAYKINPDHVHLIVIPGEEFDYSNIMHFLKRHISRNANYIMGYGKDDPAGTVVQVREKDTEATLGEGNNTEATLALY